MKRRTRGSHAHQQFTKAPRSHERKTHHRWVGALFSLALVGLQPQAEAAKNGAVLFPPAPVALPPAVPAQFDVTGFIESATLDTTGEICTPTDGRLAGGKVKVNGIEIIIPCNTVLQMPATSLAWSDLFTFNPYSPGGAFMPNAQTGLALTDHVPAPRPPLNAPLPSYELHALGNIVDGKYIAGLVYVSQQSLNAGSGYINYIDYAKGEIHVGGTPKVAGPGDIRIRINDPVGRYGKTHGGPNSGADIIEPYFDARFTADVDNPTIHAATGFPMCVPRFDPVTEGSDSDCPQINRPRSRNCKSLPAVLQGRPGFSPFVMPPDGQFCTSFMMDPPPSSSSTACESLNCPTDPTRQAPFEIGDYIDYAGTLLTDDSDPRDIHSYISAHTITAHLGIYTTPGRKPVYMAIEALLMGTNSLPIPNLPQETTSRVKVEGFTTDPSALVDIYAVDVDPITGAESSRLLGSESAALPPMIGRFRFQPTAGSFMPPTREMRVVSRTQCGMGGNGSTNADACLANAATVANGLVPGQYTAPVGEYIFAEGRIAGDPTVPANFQDFQFLYCGSGPIDRPTFMPSAPVSTPAAGQLDPSPWASPMPTPLFADSCPYAGPQLPAAAPIVNVGANRIITPGSAVTVTATATDPRGLKLTSFVWTLTNSQIPFSQSTSGSTSTLSFMAPMTPAELTFNLNVTNAAGSVGSGTITLANVSDQVTVFNAGYDSRRGALNVVANSDLPIGTTGLQLYVQATNGTAKLAATPQPMSKVGNSTATPTACPAGLTNCWSYTTTGVLINPTNRALVAPQDVIVTSSKGGSARLSGTQIIVR